MQHHFPLHEFKNEERCEGGYRVKATKSNFPALEGISFYKLFLHPKGVREPHWHANADELGYCLKGKLLISFYSNGNNKETFVISEGEVFFIPSGAIHSVENISEYTAEVLLQFSHEEPEDFDLSLVLGTFSNAILGNTWDIESSHFQDLPRPPKRTLISKLKHSPSLTKEMNYTSPYRFSLETSPPLITNQGGSARVARQNVWPILRRQALYSLRISGTGMREPHWHPETSEMGYVAEGTGRMSIISPSGKVDTYQMEKGDIYFIPKAYPHHIENLRQTELHLLIFFDQSMPQDIGFTGSIKSFSNETLSSSIHSSEDVFTDLPTYYEDLFIVNKKNPVDQQEHLPE